MRLPGGGPIPSSWINDRLPELLWGCLIISVIPRQRALELFRNIAALGMNYRDSVDAAKWRLYLSDFVHFPEEFVANLVEIVTRDPLGYASLRPLLLLDALPGKERWSALLSVEPQEHDWETLANAVIKTLDHQSQEATDVRWVSLLFKITLGKMIFTTALKEIAEEIIHYPNRGDMRAVRPSIRAMEMSVDMQKKEDMRRATWPSEFWAECFSRTTCIPAEIPRSVGETHDVRESIGKLIETREALVQHWFDSAQTTAIDARHDSAFGLCFFGMAVLLEMVVGRNAYGITGRVLLRTLVEARITLAYLKEKDDSELWNKYRAFGVGQAKLALLKLDQVHNQPRFTTPDVLERLTNEDYFQEFVAIELGHWCGLDLRKMAEASNTKEDYDRFYGWSSSFAHGHWAAVRDTTMMHCLNPLHRLHRIPLPAHRVLESCASDAVELMTAMLSDLSELYPEFRRAVELVSERFSKEHDLQSTKEDIQQD